MSIYNIEDIIAISGTEDVDILEYLLMTQFIEVAEEFIPV